MIILNLIITRYLSFQNHRNQTYLWLQSSLLPVNFLRYSHNISTINTLIFILIHVRFLDHHFSYSLAKYSQKPCSPLSITVAWQDALPCVENDVLEGPWLRQA